MLDKCKFSHIKTDTYRC